MCHLWACSICTSTQFWSTTGRTQTFLWIMTKRLINSLNFGFEDDSHLVLWSAVSVLTAWTPVWAETTSSVRIRHLLPRKQTSLDLKFSPFRCGPPGGSVLDVSSCFTLKIRLLLCHEALLKWKRLIFLQTSKTISSSNPSFNCCVVSVKVWIRRYQWYTQWYVRDYYWNTTETSVCLRLLRVTEAKLKWKPNRVDVSMNIHQTLGGAWHKPYLYELGLLPSDLWPGIWVKSYTLWAPHEAHPGESWSNAGGDSTNTHFYKK